MAKDDKSKTHPEKCHILNKNFLDLLGKARALRSSVRMSSSGIYYIDLRRLGFLTHMPKIKEKVPFV